MDRLGIVWSRLRRGGGDGSGGGGVGGGGGGGGDSAQERGRREGCCSCDHPGFALRYVAVDNIFVVSHVDLSAATMAVICRLSRRVHTWVYASLFILYRARVLGVCAIVKC